MSKIIPFPEARRIPATVIPREEFERLAGLTMDVVDEIMRLLDAVRPPELEPGVSKISSLRPSDPVKTPV